MRFLDQARIHVKAGNGGNGCLSFRRERFVPMGGPDGGDGGRGGHVIARAKNDLNTLIDCRYRQHFKARTGGHGMGRNRTGKSAEDVTLAVPVGTQVFAEDGEAMLADLAKEGDEFVLAEGGAGGLGNARFKSSTNRAPRRTTPGGDGEELTFWLRLKLIADIGLIGLPNAGKSTFLSAVSRARPKIADYPFTTLAPVLGTVVLDHRSFVIADIPGLIEGAHEGAGLGVRFLGHIERCAVLVHLVDATGEDLAQAYRCVRDELLAYGHGLEAKPELVCLSKIDALDGPTLEAKVEALRGAVDARVFALSSQSRKGVQPVLREAVAAVEAARAEGAPSETEALP